jgi:DNA-binding IclR family transcriptional regulator
MNKTLATGLKILEFLVSRAQPCSVSDVAREFSLVPSNAHRSLQTLVALGYAKQSTDSRYQASLRLFELGSQVVGTLDIRYLAHQAMAALAADTLETIHLVVRDGAHVVYLDKINSPQPVAAYSHIGGTAPAQCVASGKVLLAYAMPADNAQALAWLRDAVPVLEPYTAASHLDHRALHDDLRKVRHQGYALNRGEWREDVAGLGAPVFDAHGEAIGALGISLPRIRCTAKRLPALVASLREAAAQTSALLGFRPDCAPMASVSPITNTSTQ